MHFEGNLIPNVKKTDPKDRYRCVTNMKSKLITALDETSEPYIHHFQIWTGKKFRHVAEPFEPLKSALAEDNERILALYESLIRQKGLQDIPQAYRHNHGVHTNAVLHAKNRVWYRFDFKGFYDTVRFEDFAEYLKPIYPDILTNAEQYKRCFIDPRTNGLIQGSPTSGTLAGIALIKFWIELKKFLPEATITQYSDDLCISGVNFNQHKVQSIVKTCIKRTELNVKLNTKKTRTDRYQYRCLTGVACNNDDIVTCYRKDYRAYRTLLHHMELTDAASVLKQNDMTAEKALGKLNYMLHIDQTGKIEKLMFQYSDSIQQLKNIIIEHQRARQGGVK